MLLKIELRGVFEDLMHPGSSMSAVILLATDREFAKSYSSPLLGGDPDYYQVEPLTDKGEAVTFLLFTDPARDCKAALRQRPQVGIAAHLECMPRHAV